MPLTDRQSHEVLLPSLLSRRGEHGQWEQLYDHYAPSLYGWILKFIPDPATANQVLINAFIRAQSDEQLLQNPSGSALLVLLRFCNEEMAGSTNAVVFENELKRFSFAPIE